MGVVAPRRGASYVARGWANVVSPTPGKAKPAPKTRRAKRGGTNEEQKTTYHGNNGS
jgi:hypothetical protein